MNSHDPTLHICFVRRPLAAEMTYCAVKMHVQIFQISKNIQKNKPEAKYWQNVLLRHLAPLTLEIEKHRCLKGQHCSSSTMKGESWSDKCVCSLAVPTNKNLSESYLLWMDAPRALTQTVHRPVALIPPPLLNWTLRIRILFPSCEIKVIRSVSRGPRLWRKCKYVPVVCVYLMKSGGESRGGEWRRSRGHICGANFLPWQLERGEKSSRRGEMLEGNEE